jgi:O-antigen/teichoic acid export membrane protein
MSKLGKHSAIYGIGILLNKAVAFLMLPVYTRYLSPADYGVLHLVVMTIEVVSIAAGSWLARGIFRYYHKETTPDGKKRVLSTSLFLLAGSYAAAALVTVGIAPWIAEAVVGPEPQHVFTVRLAAASLGFESLVLVPVAFLRLRHRSGTFVTVNAVKLVLQVTFNLIFIIPLGMGVNGVVLSGLLSSLLIGVWLSAYLLRETGFGFSGQAARDLFRFGAPLMGVQIASVVLTFGDRYFLRRAGDTAAVGIYGLAYQFGMLPVTLAYLPFSQVWDPMRFELAQRNDRDELYSRGFIYMSLMMVTMTLLIALFVGDFLRLVARPAFLPAAYLVPIILVAYVVGSWTAFMNLGIFMKERTEWFTLANWVAAIVALGGYLFLIPRYLTWGAAVATAIAYIVRHVMVYAISQRLWPIRYQWGPVVRLCGIATAVCLMSLLAPSMSVVLSVLLRLGLFGLYLAGVWWGNVLRPADRHLLTVMIRSPKRARAVFLAK